MRSLILLAALAALVPIAKAQTAHEDSAAHEKILVGPVDRQAIDSTAWYKSNRQLYTPTSAISGRIDSLSSGDSVVVVFGSWCPDSHVWVPIFLNIADSTGLGKKITFIAVPRSREGQRRLTPGLNIEKVPTFIFFRNGKELGRIVETPQGDIGDDIVNILRNGK